MLFLIYFYHIVYQIMDECVFFVATFIHLFYIGFFFFMKGAGLHPSVFFFFITIMFHLSLLDPPLTSDKMAKS